MKRVRVDFNARDGRDFVPLARTRLGEDVAAGETVEVYDGEEGFYGPATVADIDTERGVAYLDVAWSELRDPDPIPKVEVRGDLVLTTSSGFFIPSGLVILSPPGSGKTSTLLKLMEQYHLAIVEEHPGRNTYATGYDRDEELIAS